MCACWSTGLEKHNNRIVNLTWSSGMIVSTRTTAGAVGGPTFLSSTGIRIAGCRGSVHRAQRNIHGSCIYAYGACYSLMWSARCWLPSSGRRWVSVFQLEISDDWSMTSLVSRLKLIRSCVPLSSTNEASWVRGAKLRCLVGVRWHI
jgi:hypothetical protein